jgi:hypothetical protein
MKENFNRRAQWGNWLLAGLTLAALILLPTLLLAQSTGTISGTVTDQTGAVVPHSKVVLINDESKETRDTTSNDVGYFSFPSLLPGNYTVKVSASGFKGWQKSGIGLNPGDVREVAGITLQIGKQDEVITVESTLGEVAPVDSGEKSAVLTSKQIGNLSLEGRDATELIRTLPGFASFNGGGVQNQGQDFSVVSPTGGAVGEGVVAGGAPYRGGTDLISDGAHILDNGCNCGATATVNGDMVAEVKVQTSNFGADSAKGPVVVNAVGKSGGTEYHGELYLHARDQSLNSLDWSFKHQLLSSPPGLVPIPASRFLYPGANIGGPVPHTGKKLVFWTGFEYYYQSQIPLPGLTVPGLLTDVVPTVSMRAGNFSPTAPDNEALCPLGSNGQPTGNLQGQGFQPMCANLGSSLSYVDPTTGVTMTGNPNPQLPASAFDPGIQAIMKNVPLPNANPVSTGGYNLLIPENVDQNGWMWRTRADYNLSESSKLYATYQVQKETDAVPVHLWWQPANSIPFPGGMSSKDNSQTISGHYVKVINPTLTNDASMGMGWINYPLVKNSASGWSASANGYPYQNIFPTKSGMMPDVGNGYCLAGVPQMIQPDIFTNGSSFTWKKWNLDFEDAVTKVYKTHTIKGGFYYERTVNDQGAFSDYNGHLEAVQGGPFQCNDAANTGATTSCGSNNPVVNFLLGVGNYDQITKSALDNLWYPTYSGYVQDDWKAMRKLTLNLGLRADHLGAWRSPTDAGVATFTGDFSNTASGIPGYTWHGIDSSVPVTGRNVPVITWQPRLGMAYDLFGTGRTVLRGGWGEYGYRDQWNDYGGPADLAQGAYQYNSPRPFTLAYVNQIGASGLIAPTGHGCGASPLPQCGSLTGLDVTDTAQPLSRNYNFTVSQQIPWSSLIEIGYVGSSTINAPLEGNTNNLDARNMNVIQQGALFPIVGCSSPLSPTNSACDINSNGIPLSAFPLNALFANNNAQVIRHVGVANYNAFQTSWVRQKGRISYNLNYTWSKTLGTQGTAQLNGLAPDATNLSHDYGVLSIDRSHVVNLSYTLQAGNPIRGNRALQYAVNGWNISGITTWQSGPDIPTLTSTNLGLGGNGPQYTSGGTTKTYAIGAEDYLGTNNENLQPIVTCDPTANLQPHQYFNANCFSVGPPGVNGPYQLPYLHGPAYFNSDLAVFKTFKVTERQNVEFRLSAFNFLNHPLDSFQNNGDSSISFTYQCGATSFSSGGPACPYGSGSYVLNNGLAPGSNFVLNGSNSKPGYASTRFGRRVLELSAKYNF